jgi:predicted pyridoxine 5'-phosphate oxidase superfamily flavin-nucleotide-binding protein
MAKITQEMKETAEKTPAFIIATASKDGKPNGVPMKGVRIISDDEIMILDNFMLKTRQNLEENPIAAISFWGGGRGYQCKGKVRIETSGKLFDEATRSVAHDDGPKRSPKAVVILKVEEIYYVGSGPNAGKRLD